MQVAVLTFDGFNELDSFVSYLIINRLKARGWQAFITSPNEHVASMNGINIQAEKPLEFAQEADAVLVGSGTKTLDIVNDSSLMSRIKLNPDIQLIGAQCSGTLVLSRLGVLETGVACTDLKTKPWVIESGHSLVFPLLPRSGPSGSGLHGQALAEISVLVTRMTSPSRMGFAMPKKRATTAELLWASMAS